MKPQNLIEKAFLLKNTPVFKSLELDSLLSISEKIELVTYPPGTPIFNEGDEALHLFLVIEGSITLNGIEKQSLKEGSFFGDEHLFSGTRRTYSATSESAVTLLCLLKRHLYAIMTECPSVAIAWLESYARDVSLRSR